MKVLGIISDKLHFYITRIAVGILGVMSVVMITQVFCRYVLNSSLSWSEELSRYCFIWFNCLGAMVLSKEVGHARISIIDALFKTETSRRVYWVILDVVMIAASAVLLVTGIKVTLSVGAQLTPALKIPKSAVYIAAPVAAVGMIIHLLNHLLHLLTAKKGE